MMTENLDMFSRSFSGTERFRITCCGPNDVIQKGEQHLPKYRGKMSAMTWVSLLMACIITKTSSTLQFPRTVCRRTARNNGIVWMDWIWFGQTLWKIYQPVDRGTTKTWWCNGTEAVCSIAGPLWRESTGHRINSRVVGDLRRNVMVGSDVLWYGEYVAAWVCDYLSYFNCY